MIIGTSAGSAVLVVLLGALASDCNPDNGDLGESVLFVWPFAVLLGLGFQRVVLAFWQRLRPTLDVGLRHSLYFFAATFVSPFVVATMSNGRRWQLWAFLMIFMFGASYATVAMLAMRVWMFASDKHVLLAGQIITSLVFIPVAIVVSLDLWPTAPKLLEFFWVPGWGSLVTSGVLVALLAEVTIRRVVARV